MISTKSKKPHLSDHPMSETRSNSRENTEIFFFKNKIEYIAAN